MKRRDFLIRAMATGAVPALAPTLALAQNAPAAAVEQFLPREISFWMRTSTDTRIGPDGVHASATYSPTGERVFRLTIWLLSPAALRGLKLPPELEGLLGTPDPKAPLIDIPDRVPDAPEGGLFLGGTVLQVGGVTFAATRTEFDGTVYWGRVARRVVVTCDATDPEFAQTALTALDLKGLARLGR